MKLHLPAADVIHFGTWHFAGYIGESLTITAVGGGIGIVGLILMLVVLFRCRYRAEWFFYFLVIYGALSRFAFPIGTIVGSVCLFSASATGANSVLESDPSIQTTDTTDENRPDDLCVNLRSCNG